MSRVQEVDALRSFALFGIAVSNFPILAKSVDALMAMPETWADTLTLVALEMFVSGKFFVLFSFLFGWGMGEQLASAERQGINPRGPFLRRLAGLCALGIAHALLVFQGDILVLYSLLGLVLWSVRGASPRRLLQLAAGGVALALPGYLLLGYGIAEELAHVPPPQQPSGFTGGFIDAVVQRAQEWPVAFGFVLLFNGPLALSAFFAGLAAHRLQLFQPGNPLWTRLSRAVPWLLAIGLIANVLHVASYGAMLDAEGPEWASIAGFALLTVGAPTLGGVYMWSVVEACRRWSIPRWFTTPGSMSGSVYVGQGILGGLLFYGYGAGLYNQLSDSGIAMAAVGVTLTLFAFANIWARWLGQGPLERILRAITRWGRSSARA
jgi:uncharacterized protein